MTSINDELKEKISSYQKRIDELEAKLQHATEEEKKKYDFELADVKSQLNLAQSELHKTE